MTPQTVYRIQFANVDLYVPAPTMLNAYSRAKRCGIVNNWGDVMYIINMTTKQLIKR